MSPTAALASAATEPLPRPYDAPPSAEALRPGAATVRLVETQVDALLASCAAYHSLGERDRRRLKDNLVKVTGYCAELIRDDWCQSKRLGQRPVVREREVLEGPVVRAQAAGDDFKPAAAGQVARVTQETLRAIAFPTFVADLIKGTFNAIIQSSIQQMEAYSKLLENVGKTVDHFMSDNISDYQARDWLAQMYPDHIKVEGGQAVPRDGADEKPAPNWRADLNLSEGVGLDESSIEEQLVPAARRKLAQSRLQLLSTMVLMGINRIVVTGGKIRATMGFHIDTTDRAHQEQATDLDVRVAAAGSFGFGPWSASLSTSVSYVSSTRKNSDAELNVDTDLTGEVEIHFKSDYFPLERFATGGAIGRIQANTAVPETNTPPGTAAPFSEPPAVGGDVGRYKSSRSRRSDKPAATLPPIGSPLPEARLPVRPTAPVVERRVNGDEEGKKGKEGKGSEGGEAAAGEPSAPKTAEGKGAGKTAAQPEKAETKKDQATAQGPTEPASEEGDTI